MIDIILSISIILIFIIYNVIVNIKYKNYYKSDLYYQTNKLNKLLFIISIIIFFTKLIISTLIYGFTLNTLYISFATCIFAIPISLLNLYKITFKDEERYSHIKKVYTTLKPTDKITNLYKKSNIKLELIDKKSNNRNTDIEYYEYKDLNTLYNLIINARLKHDNYLKTIKHNIIINLAIIIFYILVPAVGFPFIYYISLSLLIKLYLLLINILCINKLPIDDDIKIRLPKPTNIFIEKQEILFTIIESFIMSFALSIVYMFILASGGVITLVNTIYIVMLLYFNIFLVIVHINEKPFIINIIKVFKSIRVILFIILSILLSLIPLYIHYFDTINIKGQNYRGCILIAFIFSLTYELIKLARFTTIKGVKKHDKNNKKHKRSKSNNS